MINVKYKFEFRELLDSANALFRSQKKVYLGGIIGGYLFGIMFLFLSIFKLDDDIKGLILGLSIFILILATLMLLIYISRIPKVVEKRLIKKNSGLLNGAEYDLTIDNGVVTLKEKNDKAEVVTTMKVEEYKKIFVKDKYYYFYIGKTYKNIQIILPKSSFSKEQTEELIEVFGDKFKYLDQR